MRAQVLRSKGALFDLGASRLARPGSQPPPVMDDSELVRAFEALDLTDAAVCEKVELTLRHAILM